MFDSIDDLQTALEGENYFASRGLATSLYLAVRMGKPLFLEGYPGVGKTDVAKVLAGLLGTQLIRLQCYEGLDIHQAVYEWNYSRQMMHIRLLEARGETPREDQLFSEQFLIRRPLLQAIQPQGDEPVVLLIDEIDRSDEEFEAYLLEVLSDFQITIPEIGTMRARRRPFVIITSNRTREVHDALKRRCIYHWIDYPSFDKELQILHAKVPQAGDHLSRQVAAFVQELRGQDIYKRPGVAETLDWAQALIHLDRETLTPEIVHATLGLVVKSREDIDRIGAQAVTEILEQIDGDERSTR